MKDCISFFGINIHFDAGTTPDQLADKLRDIAIRIEGHETFAKYINSMPHLTAKLTHNGPTN